MRGVKYLLLTLACAGLLIMGCQQGTTTGAKTGDKKEGPSPMLAKVDGQVITVKEFSERSRRVSPKPRREEPTGPRTQKAILDDYIYDVLLLKEAEKQKLESDEQIKKRIQEFRRNQLIHGMIRKIYEKVPDITDADIEKYFNEHKDEFQSDEQIHVRHILVTDEKEAQGILKELKQGGDFAKLAEQKSICGSRTRGGDLGTFTRGKMVPEFEAAAFALQKPGDLSDIVKTKFGYHVIKLEEKKAAGAMDMASSKDRIKRRMLSKAKKEALLKFLEDLRSKAKVEVNDKELTTLESQAPAQDQRMNPFGGGMMMQPGGNRMMMPSQPGQMPGGIGAPPAPGHPNMMPGAPPAAPGGKPNPTPGFREIR